MVAHGSPARAVCVLAIVLAGACSKGHRSRRVAADAGAGAGAAAVAGGRRYGDAMMEVGRRFERAGRAVVAGRWELAGYDLGELTEVFEGDLPHAVKPDDVPIDPAPIAAQFAARSLPPLVQAVRARDRAAFDAAFAAAAKECNFCHHDAAKRFVEVPTTPGAEVPSLSPVAPPGAPQPEAGAGPADAGSPPVPDR